MQLPRFALEKFVTDSCNSKTNTGKSSSSSSCISILSIFQVSLDVVHLCHRAAAMLYIPLVLSMCKHQPKYIAAAARRERERESLDRDVFVLAAQSLKRKTQALNATTLLLRSQINEAIQFQSPTFRLSSLLCFCHQWPTLLSSCFLFFPLYYTHVVVRRCLQQQQQIKY